MLSLEQNVTPWEVEAEEEIDYGKLVRTFGSQLIDEDMVSRVERLTNQVSHDCSMQLIVLSA
jgi:tryptophanyl-tRNA synthetase